MDREEDENEGGSGATPASINRVGSKDVSYFYFRIFKLVLMA
jgi:hypothetical protein